MQPYRDQLRGAAAVVERTWPRGRIHADRPRQPRPRWTGRRGMRPVPVTVHRAAAVVKQVLGCQHPDTLIARASLARWTGEAGMRSVPVVSTQRCCRRQAGPRLRAPDRADRRANLLLRRGGEKCAGSRNQYTALLPIIDGSSPRRPGHADEPAQPRRLDPAGGDEDRWPGLRHEVAPPYCWPLRVQEREPAGVQSSESANKQGPRGREFARVYCRPRSPT